MIGAIIVFCILIIFLQRVEAEALRGGVIFSNVKGMIGARINNHGVVSCVRYRSPAQLNGLRPGDKIVMVDFARFDLGRIKGSPGERVVLTIERAGKILELEIKYADARAIDYATDPDRYYGELGGWDSEIEWQMGAETI